MVAAMEMATDLAPNAKIMTVVVDVAAGTEFPLHSHGGPGVATLLSGCGFRFVIQSGMRIRGNA